MESHSYFFVHAPGDTAATRLCQQVTEKPDHFKGAMLIVHGPSEIYQASHLNPSDASLKESISDYITDIVNILSETEKGFGYPSPSPTQPWCVKMMYLTNESRRRIRSIFHQDGQGDDTSDHILVLMPIPKPGTIIYPTRLCTREALPAELRENEYEETEDHKVACFSYDISFCNLLFINNRKAYHSAPDIPRDKIDGANDLLRVSIYVTHPLPTPT